MSRSLPSKVHTLGPVRDQGELGSSTAHGAMAAMEHQAPSFMDDAPAPAVPQDRLARIRELAEGARTEQLRLRELSESTDAAQARLSLITRTLLPELMTSAGMPAFELEARGNLPALSFRVETQAQASIPQSWDDERRAGAMAELDRVGGGDLIQTTVSVDFPREKREAARNLLQLLVERGLRPYARETVHHSRLSAWLRSRLKSGELLPDLEKIGGWAATVARIEEPRS
jgi:hypothetical protein